jgi:hypothetical protein
MDAEVVMRPYCPLRKHGEGRHEGEMRRSREEADHGMIRRSGGDFIRLRTLKRNFVVSLGERKSVDRFAEEERR